MLRIFGTSGCGRSGCAGTERAGATDETLHAFDLVRRMCRDARKALPADASDKLHAILASAKTVAAVERLAKSDRRLAATADQWDRDPDVLNTPVRHR